MAETAIEWATHVWNPFTGCDQCSEGCENCYAIPTAEANQRKENGRLAKARREGKPDPKLRYQNDGNSITSGPGFDFTVHWDKLEKPQRFPAGARVFVNSMSDVFHKRAPIDAIARLFACAAEQPQANFLILTKRSKRMRAVVSDPSFEIGVSLARDQLGEMVWPLPNVWLGVSIENRRRVRRADDLRAAPAAVRFISAEPLLGPLIPNSTLEVCEWQSEEPVATIDEWGDGYSGHGLDLTDIDWLIVGGESGKDHRPIEDKWVRDLRDATRSCDPEPAFFFKQWGGNTSKAGGRDLDGCQWSELPDSPVPSQPIPQPERTRA